MSFDPVTILIVGASLVSLGLLASCFGRVRTAGELDASTALTLAMGAAATLPIAAVAVAGGVVRRPDALGQLTTFFPSWYATADNVAKVMLLILVAVLLVGRMQTRPVIVHGAAFMALLLWTIAQLASLQHDAGGPPIGSFVLLVCLLAAVVLPRGRGASVGVATWGLGIAIASGILALFRHDVAFIVPCTGACSGLGFTGVFPNENLLGIALVASMPFAYLAFHGRVRVWFVLYLAGMAAASGSRTAVGAGLITLVALLVVRPRLDAAFPGRGRSAIAWVLLAGAAATAAFIVLHTWSSVTLTGRPQLWDIATDYIGRSPWIGYGPSRWASLYTTSEIPFAAQRSAHNLWLDVLFVSGVVGATFFIGALLMTVVAAGRARVAVVLALATIFMVGATEGSWTLGTFDFMSVTFVALLLTGATQALVHPRPIKAMEGLGHRGDAAATPLEQRVR